MKLLRLSTNIMAAITVVVTATNTFAHDSHSHTTSNDRLLPAYDPNRLSTIRDRYQTTGASSSGCAVGGCCSTTGCSINSRAQVGSDLNVTRTSVSTADELERLSQRMLSTIRDEMRGSRNYNALVADAGDAVRSASRMRAGEARRISNADMLQEARTMLTPLKRMNSALKEEQRGEASLRAVQETGRLLVSFGRDLQDSVARTAPSDRNLLPPRTVPADTRRQSGLRIPAEMKDVALLPTGEQEAALRQRTCPVIGEPLGSMGKPIRVDVSGRSVYVCCQGCVNAVQRNPQKYLSSGTGGGDPGSRFQSQGNYPEMPRGPISGRSAQQIPADMKGVALLPIGEQPAALRQRTCPVNGEPLGSMGKPIRVDVSGRSVYVCCAGCVNAVKRNPQKYLR